MCPRSPAACSSAPATSSCCSGPAAPNAASSRSPGRAPVRAVRPTGSSATRSRHRHAVDVDDPGLPAQVAPYAGAEEFEPYAVGYVELGGESPVEGRLTEADPARLRIGMPMEVTPLVVARRGGRPPRPVRLRRPCEASRMSDRRRRSGNPSVRPARGRQRPRMAVHAVRQRSPTPASPGATSSSPPAAPTRRQRRHDGLRPRPDRPPVHQRQERMRHRRLGATAAHASIQSGGPTSALVVGFDKHPPGAFRTTPRTGRLASGTARRADADHAVLRHKIQRYMHEHGIPTTTLAKVAEKAFRTARSRRHAWRRTPLTAEQILGSQMVAHPLTQYMFCSPGEGAVALVLARADTRARARARPGVPALRRVPHAAASARSRCSARRSSSSRAARRASMPRVRRSSGRRSGRRRSMSRRCRTRRLARSSCTSPRPGSASTASRRL